MPKLTRDIVRNLSAAKNEPAWILKKRLDALSIFESKPMPIWGADLSTLDLNSLDYYLPAAGSAKKTWQEVPASIRKTFDSLRVTQAEQDFLAGLGAQFDSETIYHHLNDDLAKQGVIFTDIETAIREHSDLVKQYFGKLIPPTDNKFAALNNTAFSGGTFIYVPPCVHVTIPLHAYFRINAERFGQFERTLIVVDEGASVHYIEGCTAPNYSTSSLHAAVVEIFAKRNSKVRYTTIQNWATNVFNLTTKRALAEENAIIEWVDGNIGSGVTMKYPCVILKGRCAKADILSLSLAGPDQHLDAGSKVIHLAPDTTSTVLQKSVSYGGGQSSYRGLLEIRKSAKNAIASTRCDSLLLDDQSQANTWPKLKVETARSTLSHEASTGRVSNERLFYLMSRGLSETEALAMLVNGFFEPIVKEIPLEYAAELNRLIQLSMENSIG